MNSTDWLGWASSALIVVTLGKQVYEQWRRGTSKGVSKWLFVGQIAASIGFAVYSGLIKNWIFLCTNALLTVNAVTGLLILLHHRRRERRPETETVPWRVKQRAS